MNSERVHPSRRGRSRSPPKRKQSRSPSSDDNSKSSSLYSSDEE